MRSVLLLFAALLLLPLCSAETSSLMLGERYNFTLNGSEYTMALVGLTQKSATFTVADKIATVNSGEAKVLSLDNDTAGDLSVAVDGIMPNGSVAFSLESPEIGENACTPINSSCSNFNECCAGNCIVGMCSYAATINPNPDVSISLDVPENVTLGSAVRLRTVGEDGNPVADVTVDVITPLQERLTLTTNQSGDGFYIATQEGVYSYAVYNYLLNSSRTTLSARPEVPQPPVQPPETPQEPFCGDGNCSTSENCSTCSQDCGTCVQTPAEPPAPQEPAYSWLMWMGLMLLVIIIILRIVLPVFIRMD